MSNFTTASDYYQSRCDELNQQLLDMSRRHRLALQEVRRAKITTAMIRKLYRLEYAELPVDELAAMFLDLVTESLGVPRALLLRKRAEKSGFSVVAAHGMIAPAGPVFANHQEAAAFMCTGGPESKGSAQEADLRALLEAGEVIWSANPVSGLALALGNKVSGDVDHWQFSAEDRHMIEAVLDVVASVMERSRVERMLTHNAYHDSLTGLPNRSMMIRHLERCTRRTERGPGQVCAVLFLDVDRFKLVNDSLGHMAGDTLLMALSQRLRAVVRPGDLLARLAGDEFAILADGLRSLDDAKGLARRILKDLRQPFRVRGHSIYVSVSIGIAESGPQHASAAELLRDADIAMYHAKGKGGARLEVFGSDMRKRAVTQLRLETELREALDKEELSLYYQPIFSLKSRSVVAMEALLRWHHPRDGLLEPSKFVPMMEETGLGISFGNWVIQRVVRDLNIWANESEDLNTINVCVNVSEAQFVQADFVDSVAAILHRGGIDPRRLRLELTERMLLDCKSIETSVLERLRRMGVKIMLDDFGTGYSSLSRLQRLPIDTVKIDRSFVGALDAEGESRSIVKTIVTLARSLGMHIIAEGAENLEQLSSLQRLGCDYVQGYATGRPMAASQVSQFLSNHAASISR